MRILVVVTTALLLVECSSCLADETQDAIDLIGFAMQCPFKPMEERNNAGLRYSHTIAKSLSDSKTLRISWETTRDGESTSYKNRFSVKFADIGTVSKSRSRSEVFSDGRPVIDVQVSCARGAMCINYNFNEESLSQDADMIIPACDEQTADRIILGVNKLVQVNGSAARSR